MTSGGVDFLLDDHKNSSWREQSLLSLWALPDPLQQPVIQEAAGDTQRLTLLALLSSLALWQRTHLSRGSFLSDAQFPSKYFEYFVHLTAEL